MTLGRRPEPRSGKGPRIRPQYVGIVLVLLGLAYTVVAFAQPQSGIVHPPNEAGKSPAQLGSELFAANCASCHGPNGQGVSPAAPNSGPGDITELGPDLRGVGAIAPDFYLRTGRMPLSEPNEVPERHRPFFSGREIRALTAYIASLGKGPPIPKPKPKRASLAQGLSLFTEHCAGCHQVVGEGGYVTDTKVPVLKHATATQIAEAVRVGPYLMPSFPRKAISDHDLNAIVAYVRSSDHPDDAGGLGIGHIGPVPEGMVAWAVAGLVLVGVCVLIGSRMKRS
jgi:ubiquinol-cytochrome c reductase cytochrome c subunit